MKALTSFFGLIPTNDIEINGAKEFMKGVVKGMVTEESIRQLRQLIEEDDEDDDLLSQNPDMDPKLIYTI